MIYNFYGIKKELGMVGNDWLRLVIKQRLYFILKFIIEFKYIIAQNFKKAYLIYQLNQYIDSKLGKKILFVVNDINFINFKSFDTYNDKTLLKNVI